MIAIQSGNYSSVAPNGYRSPVQDPGAAIATPVDSFTFSTLATPVPVVTRTPAGVNEPHSNFHSFQELLDEASQRFETTRGQLLQRAEAVQNTDFALSPNGDFVKVSREDGCLVVESPQHRLVERDGSVTLEGHELKATLFTQDGMFHRSGDFVVHLRDRTLARNPSQEGRIEHSFGDRFEVLSA